MRYSVGDVITFDSNFRGVSPKLKTGTIVRVGRGIATHGYSDPGYTYVVETKGGSKMTVDESMIVHDDIEACKKITAAYRDDDLIDEEEYDDEEYEEDDYRDSGEWELLDTKRVLDSNGFFTDYSLYYSILKDLYVCVFGDRDFYRPEDEYYDVEFETENEAYEWFENYEGPGEEDFEEYEEYEEYDEGDGLEEYDEEDDIF